jgi:plastocyanin
MTPFALPHRLKAVPVATLATAALIALAGCGSSNNDNTSSSSAPAATTPASTPSTSSSSSGGGETLKLAADSGGALKFDKSTLTAKAGTVTIEMDNPSSVPHAVAVEGNGVDKDGETVTQGGVSKVTVDLKPGTYEFYCPVDGHKDAGMKGTLTVS